MVETITVDLICQLQRDKGLNRHGRIVEKWISCQCVWEIAADLPKLVHFKWEIIDGEEEDCTLMD